MPDTPERHSTAGTPGTPATAANPAADALPDPFQALERQLASAPGAEVQILASLGPSDGEGPDTALDFLFGRLSALLDEAVARVREEWGDPGFQGTVEADTFPVWSDALVLATWWHGDKVAWLGVRQEEDHDPLTLEAGAHTQDELEHLQSWHPAYGAPGGGAPPAPPPAGD